MEPGPPPGAPRDYRGIVARGRGLGAPRMADPAMAARIRRLTDLDVVPGTLNVVLPFALETRLSRYVGAEALGGFPEIPGRRGLRYDTARVAGRIPAVAFQGDEPEYPANQVELVAPVHLRTELALADGDAVTFTLWEADEPDTPTAEDVRRVVAELLAAWNARDREAYLALHAPDATYDDPTLGDRSLRGREALGALFDKVLEIFPDFRVEVRRIVAEQGRAVAEVTESGTQAAPIPDLQRTLRKPGRAFVLPAVMAYRVGGDGVRAVRGYFDLLGLLRQLGLA